ncbi:MAG: response regulator [Pelobacteraceae bacterium]
MTNEAYKILIVDDEELNRKLLSRLLSCAQNSLYTAGNGKDALELAERINPDLVLLDVLMPGLDGAETCRMLKSTEGTSRIPIIMLTAHPDKDTKLRCLKAGANDFLAKPVDNDELQLRVNNLLEFKKHAETRTWNSLLEKSKETLEEKNRELEAALQEIERAQAQIIQQEKMASIGQIAAGVAHEINNPVGYIMSNLGSLQKYFSKLTGFIEIQSGMITDSDHKGRLADQRRTSKLDIIIEDTADLIRESIEGAERIKKIVQDLKGFARTDEDERKPADINAGIESMLNVIWNELKYKVTLIRDFGDISMADCNIGQLSQVFMNIVVNASHAIEQQGEITIRTFQENAHIIVVISDNGCGIPKEIFGKIFEPFFTTKEVGKGTGLGLSISYGIVKKHNGELTVDSEVGKGTTFTVKIPIVSGQEAEIRNQSSVL